MIRFEVSSIGPGRRGAAAMPDSMAVHPSRARDFVVNTMFRDDFRCYGSPQPADSSSGAADSVPVSPPCWTVTQPPRTARRPFPAPSRCARRPRECSGTSSGVSRSKRVATRPWTSSHRRTSTCTAPRPSPPPRTSTPRSPPRAGPSARGAARRPANGSSPCSGSPTRWSSAPRSSPTSSPWTRASPGPPSCRTRSCCRRPDPLLRRRAARNLEGRSAGEYLPDHTSFVRREPIGVVAQVTPWNYPLNMACVVPRTRALARERGTPRCSSRATPHRSRRCCSPRSPPSSCRRGVLNVVLGDRSTGAAMIDHPTPQLVSITGSVRQACRSPAPRRPTSSARTWNSAARPRSSCSTTPTSVRGLRDRRRGVLQRRPGLHRRHPAARAGGHPRRVRRGPRRRGPRRTPAPAPTSRTPRSAP